MTHLAFQNTLTPHVIVFLHTQGAVIGRGSSVISHIATQPDVLAANYRRMPGEPTREEVAQAIFNELCARKFIKRTGALRAWTVTPKGILAVKLDGPIRQLLALRAKMTNTRQARAIAKIAAKRYCRRGLAPSTTE